MGLREMYRVSRSEFTNREADQLADKYGFASVKDLAAEIPENGKIIDVGSGASDLCLRVAELRPDVECVNLDPRYRYRLLRQHVTINKSELGWSPNVFEVAPSNVRYHGVDVSKLRNLYSDETFDRVYSMWMLPWIKSLDSEKCRQSIADMLAVTNYSGKLAIGPIHEPLGYGTYARDIFYDSTLTIQPSELTIPLARVADDISESIFAVPQSPRIPRVRLVPS